MDADQEESRAGSPLKRRWLGKLWAVLLSLAATLIPLAVSQLPPTGDLQDYATFAASVEHRRSPHWPTVRKAHLKENPFCAFAGCNSPTPLEVHHIQPFSRRPDLELVRSNLLTLCRFHHLWCGHCGNYHDINPQIRECCRTGHWPAKGWEKYQAREKRLSAAKYADE